MKSKIGFLLVLFLLNVNGVYAQKYQLPSIRYQNQKLVYTPDSLGNQIPDFSYCGYQLSETKIPFVPVKVVVSATTEDAGKLLQNAINYVSDLPLQENGFRGAILLNEGIYNIEGRLKISASGVVIRGSGKNTVIRAGGTNRETLLQVLGKKDSKQQKEVVVAANYVPVNATKILVKNTEGLKVGNQILIHRPSTKEWIDKLKMAEFGGETDWLGWKPGEREIFWERKIANIEGKSIVLNAPITAALDAEFGKSSVSVFSWPGRITNIGIENLTLESEFNAENQKDEDHCWFAITMENVKDAWVRQVNFKHFAGSAVALFETASQVTVEDCISTKPVSEIAGQRRNTFFTMGQQNLFLRCYAENGNHDFSTGFCAAGPNVFVQCESVNANNFSGAIDSWATGVLFDMVNVDGQALSFKNRGQDGQGAGWTAANSMFWQCSAGRIECFCPPTAQNYAYGTWAQFAGDGLWYEANSHINPRSLFFAQLAERLGKDVNTFQSQLIPFKGESTSSPSIEQAKVFTDLSAEPPVQLKDFIEKAGVRNPISLDYYEVVRAENIPSAKTLKVLLNPIEIKNGYLVCSTSFLTGLRIGVPWWRGDPRPFEAIKASPAITRFVPGRVGNGFTDDLKMVVGFMEKNKIAAIDHNYGLWYDRRRDDHERVKRFDAESWAPFYEQPFARSGIGEAWDRLSKYDITSYNLWYWKRLKDFTRLAEENGKILIHQNYFQHNIIEAGAHWTDSPWRPANNINNTGFPEPPPYSGDKRIYLAEQFYDVSHPVRSEFHRAYIRQCLNNFVGQSNVIQSISAEFTGPLHFVEFWLDVIAEWEKETRNNVFVALSTTKDVQDAILDKPKYLNVVDIIDIQYWAFRADGSIYEPPGGVNLAPRQHARKVNPGSRSFESVYKAVSAYRTKFPDKVVLYSESNFSEFGWAVLMGGGSLPSFLFQLPNELASEIVNMNPVTFPNQNKNVFVLKESDKQMLVYKKGSGNLKLNLSELKGEFEALFILPQTGEMLEEGSKIEGGKQLDFKLPVDKDLVIWIRKNQ